MSGQPARLVQTHVNSRVMLRIDIPEVLKIEHASSEVPWCEREFCRVLCQPYCIGMVAEFNDIICGFMIYEFHSEMIRLLNIAVHQNFRRQSVGRQMVDKLVSRLSSQGLNRLSLYLRETNLQAQFFFRAVGFSAVEVARNHFADTGEDAYGMEYRTKQERDPWA